MPLQAISVVLSIAGRKLLSDLVVCAQERGEQTDDPVFIIIEHWARAALMGTDLSAIFDMTQQRFVAYEQTRIQSRRHWLESTAAILEFGGEGISTFVTDVWLTYFFEIDGAFSRMKHSYPHLCTLAEEKSNRRLSSSWDSWRLPMRDFMAIAEGAIIRTRPSFEWLLVSQDAIDLIEQLNQISTKQHF